MNLKKITIPFLIMLFIGISIYATSSFSKEFFQLKESADIEMPVVASERDFSNEVNLINQQLRRTNNALNNTIPLTPISYNVIVDASGNQAGNPPTHVLDNNLDTRWAHKGVGQWLLFDLIEEREVEAIDIAYYLGNTRTNYFEVQYSNDGENFETILSNQESSGLTNELERYYFPELVTARYIRLMCNGNSGGGENWNSVTEVRLIFEHDPNEIDELDIFGTIMERVQAMEWDNAPSISSLNNTVSNLINSIESNGSWSDIPYGSTAQTAWEPIEHLNRLKSMVLAYTIEGTSFYGDETLYNHIVNALQYWQDSDPRSTNWFNQQIGSPQRVGVLLILMRAGENKVPATLENSMLARMQSIGGRPDQSGSQGTGANKVDIATHWVYRACLQENMSDLAFGVRQVYYPLFMTTDEGLQHDYSYFQHGQQFFTGGYGVSFISGISRVANFTKGTILQLNEVKQELITEFTRDNYLRLMRGKYFLYNTIGRGLSRQGALNASGSIALSNYVKNLDDDKKEEYEAAIKRLGGNEDASYGVTTKHLHYWRADYTLYNSPAYHFDVRMASTRTLRSENGNGESLKGYFLTEGAHTIAVDGDEYFNIFPVWNWTQIPGITAPQKSSIPQPAQWGTPGNSTFAGGVSNGEHGVTTYFMNNNDYSINTRAKKAWFMFGDEIVSIGSDITSTATESIFTTINQTSLKGDVVISENGSESTLSTKGDHNKTADWVYHNKVGYIFPHAKPLNISNKNQTGTWYSINTSEASGTVNKDVFTMYFDHGAKPSSADYAYIIVPGKSLEEIRNYDASNIEILINSDTLQVVRHVEKDLWGFVFYDAASFDNGDFKLRVNGSAALMLQNPNAGEVKAWISDPSQIKSNLKVQLKNNSLANEKEVNVELPDTPYKGSTVDFTIDEESDDYIHVETEIIKIPVLEDAYIVNGGSAASNFGLHNYILLKKDNAGYNREGLVKFDFTALAGIDPDSIERIQMVFYVKRANSSIGATNWELLTAADNDWSESTVTWNNSPAYGTQVGLFPGSVAGTKVVYDIKDLLLDEILKSNFVLSFYIRSTDRGGDAKTDAEFYSKEYSDESLRPILEIEKILPGEGSGVEKLENTQQYHLHPVKYGEALNVSFDSNMNSSISIQISDLSGRVHSETSYMGLNGNNTINLQTSHLSKGIYIIRIDNENSTSPYVSKFIIN